MARLSRRFAPLVYGVIRVAITTAVATAVAVIQSTGFAGAALAEWAVAWLLIVIFISPVPVITSEASHRWV
jgi:hypothetical protein